MVRLKLLNLRVMMSTAQESLEFSDALLKTALEYKYSVYLPVRFTSMNKLEILYQLASVNSKYYKLISELTAEHAAVLCRNNTNRSIMLFSYKNNLKQFDEHVPATFIILANPKLHTKMRLNPHTKEKIMRLTGLQLATLTKLNLVDAFLASDLECDKFIDIIQLHQDKFYISGILKYLELKILTVTEVLEFSIQQLKKFAIPGVINYVDSKTLSKAAVLIKSVADLQKITQPCIFEAVRTGKLKIDFAFRQSAGNLAKVGLPGVYDCLSAGKISAEKIFATELETLKKLGIPGIVDYINKGYITVDTVFYSSKFFLNRLARPGVFQAIANKVITFEQVVEMTDEQLDKFKFPWISRFISTGKISFEDLDRLSDAKLKKISKFKLYLYVDVGIFTNLADALEQSEQTLAKLAIPGVFELVKSKSLDIRQIESSSEQRLMQLTSWKVQCYARQAKKSLTELLTFPPTKLGLIIFARGMMPAVDSRILDAAYEQYNHIDYVESLDFSAETAVQIKAIAAAYKIYQQLDNMVQEPSISYQSAADMEKLGFLIYELLQASPKSHTDILDMLFDSRNENKYVVAMASNTAILALIKKLDLESKKPDHEHYLSRLIAVLKDIKNKDLGADLGVATVVKDVTTTDGLLRSGDLSRFGGGGGGASGGSAGFAFVRH